MGKTNYFKIGLFVLGAVVLLVLLLIAFGVGNFGSKKIYFETYFDESVQGLSSGSTVHFRGFPIGKVERITFLSQEYDFPIESEQYRKYRKYVMVEFSIDQKDVGDEFEKVMKATLGSFIEDGGRIRMTQQPLTGIAYLDIDYLDPGLYSVMDIEWKPRHIYIPSAPSVISTLSQSAEAAFKNLAQIDFAMMLEHADELIVNLNAAVKDAEIRKLSKDVRAFISEIRVTNAQVQGILGSDDTAKLNATLPGTIEKLDRSLGRIDMMIKSKQGDIEEIVVNIREISENLKELTSELKQHPSKLLFSKPPEQTEIVK